MYRKYTSGSLSVGRTHARITTSFIQRRCIMGFKMNMFLFLVVMGITAVLSEEPIEQRVIGKVDEVVECEPGYYCTGKWQRGCDVTPPRCDAAGHYYCCENA